MKPGERDRLIAAKALRDAYLHYLEWQEKQVKAHGGKESQADIETFLHWVGDELA